MSQPDEEAPVSLAGIDLERMLALALEHGARPAERLTERLECPDGTEWFEKVVLPRLVRSNRSAADVLLAKAPDLGELIELESWCKRLAAHKTRDSELASMCGYLLCVAAAARSEPDEPISSRPPEELARACLDLATVLPDPWRELLAAGASLMRSD